MLPDNDLELCLGDRILFCGRPRARRILDSSLHNSYTLRYLLTGEDEARGYVLGWFARWWRGRRAASGPLPR